MMKSAWTVTVLFAVTLTAGLAWSQAAPMPGNAQPELQVRVIAIEGTSTGCTQVTAANSLRGLRKVLERLGPSDTFTEVARREAPVQPGQEALVPINRIYRLGITPLQPTESGGIYFGARVEQREGARVQNAIITEGEAAPGQSMIFRGLDGPTGGELILIMQFLQEQDENESGGESTESDPPEESDQQEQSDQQESDDESEDEQEPLPQPEDEGEAEEESPQPEPDSPLEDVEEGDENDQEPQELDNLEAILESLEEMDNREQMEMRNRPRRVQSAGDWW